MCSRRATGAKFYKTVSVSLHGKGFVLHLLTGGPQKDKQKFCEMCFNSLFVPIPNLVMVKVVLEPLTADSFTIVQESVGS